MNIYDVPTKEGHRQKRNAVVPFLFFSFFSLAGAKQRG